MTPEQAIAYANDPNSPKADAIQIHDLYDAASGDTSVRFEDSEFSRLAHVCEACGRPLPVEPAR